MIILDFDDTLFDTQHYIRDICAVFVSQGVTETDARETMSSSILEEKTKIYNYTFEHQIDALRARGYHLPSSVLDALCALTDQRDYSFPESVPCLHRLKALGHSVVLLSAGNDMFQRRKIASTSMAPLFDDVVIVPSHKEHYVASVTLRDDDILFFINDKSPENEAVKRECPETVVITKHNPYKAVGDYAPTMPLPTFDSLLEITTYVETYAR